MGKLRETIHRNRELSLFLLDTFSIILAYVLGFCVRFIDGGESIYAYADYFQNILVTLPFVLVLNYLFFYLLKINRSLWKYISIDEVAKICFATAVSNLIWFVLVCTLPVRPYIRSVPVFAMMFQMLIMLGLRFAYRMYRKRDLEKTKTRNALIVGAGSAGSLLYRDILTNDRFDARVVGYLDDNPGLKGKFISGVEILGSVADMEQVCREKDVNLVYIAIPSASKKRIAEILEQCQSLGLKANIMDYTVKKDLQEQSSLREVSVEDLLGRDEVKLDMQSINDYLHGKTIMITGGGGSIGSELCRQIVKFEPKRMVLMDIYENTMYELQQEIRIKQRLGQISEKIEVICLLGSVRDTRRLNEIICMYPIDVLYHAAAHKHVPLVEDSPREAIKNNVAGTHNVLECCIKNGVKKFILISTDKAVNPTNVMGATKRITELLIQSYRDNGVTQVGAVRFGNVLGSHGSVVPLFREQIAAGGPVTVTHKDIERYFMTIPEAARLVLQAGAYANNGDIFVLDMGTRMKILTLAENMITLSGFKPYVDIPIEFVGLRPGEKMYEEICLGNEKRYKTDNDRVFVNEPMNIDSKKFLAEMKQLEENAITQTDSEVEKELFSIVEEYK